MHVLAGMGVLLFVARQVASRPLEGRTLRNIESGASFWHLVDLLWIVLFPGLAIVFTALSLQLLGDGIRDLLDPRLRKSM